MNAPPPFQNPRELHEAHDDLIRLLALRQHPVIALRLRQRFVDACLASSLSAWPAYGFGVATALVRSIHAGAADALSANQLAGLDHWLEALERQPVPPLSGASSWSEDLAAARAVITTSAGTDSRTATHRPARPGPPATGNAVCHVMIPVVAELIDPHPGHPLYSGLKAGLLVGLRVSVEFLGRSSEDEILVVDGDAAPETRAGFAEAIAVLDRMRLPGVPAAHRCRFRARCLPARSRLRGRSATLGFLLAAAAARSRYSLGATYRGIEADTAITGDLSGTRAQPVDPETLREKIEACLGGPIRRIVAPQGQAEEARAILRELTRDRPEGFVPPEIIAVGELRSVWRAGSAPLRTLRRSPRSLLSQWADRLTRSRLRMGLAGVAFVVSTSALAIWLSLRSAPPVSVEWANETTLVARNAHRLVTHRVDLPFRPGFHADMETSAILLVRDLDGDGGADLMAIHGSMPQERDLLTAVHLDRHSWWTQRGCRILWTRNSHRPAPEACGLEADLLWWSFHLPADPHAPPEFIAISRSHQGSLSVVSRLDRARGALLGILRNDGHLGAIHSITFVASHDTLLALSGTSNPLGRGLVAVIDPKRMRMPDPFRTVEDARRLTDPAAFDTGVVAAWSVLPDRFGGQRRTECQRTYCEADGTLRIETVAYTGRGCLIYELDPGDLQAPVVNAVYFTDATLDQMRREGLAVPEDAVDAETDRLAAAVQTLTPEGWHPAKRAGRFLPAAAAPAPRPSIGDGQAE